MIVYAGLFLNYLFLFLCAHFVGDFVLQSDLMAKNKSPLYPEEYRGNLPPWGYWMTAHALVHGLLVYLVAPGGSVKFMLGGLILGIGETIVHFFVDVAKCRGYLTLAQDQLVHILTKFAWAGAIIFALWLNV